MENEKWQRDSERASYRRAGMPQGGVPRGMAVPAMTDEFDYFVNFVAT
jgi:hypothetical protein